MLSGEKVIFKPTVGSGLKVIIISIIQAIILIPILALIALLPVIVELIIGIIVITDPTIIYFSYIIALVLLIIYIPFNGVCYFILVYTSRITLELSKDGITYRRPGNVLILKTSKGTISWHQIEEIIVNGIVSYSGFNFLSPFFLKRYGGGLNILKNFKLVSSYEISLIGGEFAELDMIYFSTKQKRKFEFALKRFLSGFPNVSVSKPIFPISLTVKSV